jgi:hypothetical protein
MKLHVVSKSLAESALKLPIQHYRRAATAKVVDVSAHFAKISGINRTLLSKEVGIKGMLTISEVNEQRDEALVKNVVGVLDAITIANELS